MAATPTATGHRRKLGPSPGLRRSTRKEPAYETASIALEFRPLCPCLAKWEEEVGVWVGSADDASLRFFLLSTAPEDPPARRLESISLPPEHFAMATPIMGMDFLSVDWEEMDCDISSTKWPT